MEKRVHQEYLQKYDYEPADSTLRYSVPHKYTPDFVGDDKRYIIEVKGFFKDSADASRYVAISRDNPLYTLIFLFSNPYKKAYSTCKPRKDGTTLTLAEWATKHGFLYYSIGNIPEEIINCTITKQWVEKEKEKQRVNT